MYTARQESFSGDGNHDVHKITHSAESERFGRNGQSLSSISLEGTLLALHIENLAVKIKYHFSQGHLFLRISVVVNLQNFFKKKLDKH